MNLLPVLVSLTWLSLASACIHSYPAGPNMGFTLATAGQNDMPDDVTWKKNYLKTHPGVDFGGGMNSWTTRSNPRPKKPRTKRPQSSSIRWQTNVQPVEPVQPNIKWQTTHVRPVQPVQPSTIRWQTTNIKPVQPVQPSTIHWQTTNVQPVQPVEPSTIHWQTTNVQPVQPVEPPTIQWQQTRTIQPVQPTIHWTTTNVEPVQPVQPTGEIRWTSSNVQPEPAQSSWQWSQTSEPVVQTIQIPEQTQTWSIEG